MDFEIIGEIRHPETFARDSGIRELPRLRKIHGYEAADIGKREFKIKRYIE